MCCCTVGSGLIVQNKNPVMRAQYIRNGDDIAAGPLYYAVMSSPRGSRSVSSRRLWKLLLAAAAVIVLAAGVFLAQRQFADPEHKARRLEAELCGQNVGFVARWLEKLGLGRESRPAERVALDLADLGPVATPHLVRALSHGDVRVRIAAAKALGRITPPAADAVIPLVKTLRKGTLSEVMLVSHYFVDGPGTEVRTAIARSLAEIGEPAIPSLVRLLRSGDPSLDKYATKSLGWMGAKVRTVAVRDLTDKNAAVRRDAAYLLGYVEAKDAIPILIRALGDKDASVREEAAYSLAWIGRRSVSQLVGALQDRRWEVREAAVRALGFMGPDAKAILPRVVEMLEDDTSDVRRCAAEALALIGADTALAADALERAGQDDSARVRQAAARGMQRIKLQNLDWPSVTFCGTKANAHHIVYVIDRSVSMIDSFGMVKREMATSVGELTAAQYFSVVIATDPAPEGRPANRLTPAVEKHKLDMVRYVKYVYPLSTTAVAPAMSRAFELLRLADPSRQGKVVFFVTGRMPPDAGDLEKLIRKLNADKDVRINTCLYWDRSRMATRLLKRIARENNGDYAFIDMPAGP